LSTGVVAFGAPDTCVAAVRIAEANDVLFAITYIIPF
jgi:hypothetical protein